MPMSARLRERLLIVPNELPPAIANEVAGWPEFRMSVTRVRVELADGRTFDDVMVAVAALPRSWVETRFRSRRPTSSPSPISGRHRCRPATEQKRTMPAKDG